MKNGRETFWYFLAGLILLLLIFFESFIKVNKDFDVFIGASNLLLEGKSCYNVWMPSGKISLIYFYSPVVAFLFSPLTYLPKQGTYVVWMILNYFFLYRTFKCIAYFLDLNTLSEKIKKVFFVLLLICSLRFILYNFDMGQMTLFLLFASLESVRLILEKKTIAGAALLALAIVVKLLPLPVLAYLIYRKEFKAAISVILFFISILFLPGLFLGMDFNIRLLQEWWAILKNIGMPSPENDIDRPNLQGMLYSLLMESSGKVPLKRNIFSFRPETILWTLRISSAVLVTISIYFLRTFPFRKIESKMMHFYGLSYLLLIAPLIAPRQENYSLSLAVPAIAYCLYMALKSYQNHQTSGSKPGIKEILSYAGIILSFIFLTITSDGIIGRPLSRIAEHFYLIQTGILILILPLSLFVPAWKK